MKSMFQMGFQRSGFLPLRAGQVPLLGQFDGESSTNIFSDIEKAAAVILAPGKTAPLTTQPTSIRPAPAANSTGILVGAALLGAVIAGVLFLT